MDWLTNPSSLHPTPSPRAISGYKDLKEPVSLSSGIILLQPAGFSLVLKLLYNICWRIASSIMYWAVLPLNFSLGYKCSRIFHSNLLFIPDKGFTSLHITPSFHPPQLALPPILLLYITLLCFLHFLYAEFLGLAILLSSCLRQYNVCSIFCFLSVLNLPSVVYTDSLLSVRSRIPRHLFACLQATFYDLSPLVIH